jgi:hypothetical protein
MDRSCPKCKAKIKYSQFMYLQINDYKIVCSKCHRAYIIDKFVYYVQMLVFCAILVLIGYRGPTLVDSFGLKLAAQNVALLLLLPIAIAVFIIGQSYFLSFWINKRY